MEQITKNKYIKFYQEVKEFIVKTKLTDIKHINEVSEKDIDSFEKEYAIILPMALRFFYYFFGETSKANREVFYSFPFKNLFFAQKEKIKVSKTILEEINSNYGNVVFFEYDTLSNSLVFCKSLTDNPQCHYLFELNDLLFDESETSFTNFLRQKLFTALYFKFYGTDNLDKNNVWDKIEIREHELIDLSKVQWADFYYEFYRNLHSYKKVNANFVINHRKNFYKLIAEEEERGDFLYSIDEFELKFIEYLKSKIE